MTPAPTDSDRLAVYVERFFQRSGKTEWPTVQRAARSLRWRQERVYDAIEGDPKDRMFTSSYFTASEPKPSEHFIETM